MVPRNHFIPIEKPGVDIKRWNRRPKATQVAGAPFDDFLNNIFHLLVERNVLVSTAVLQNKGLQGICQREITRVFKRF